HQGALSVAGSASGFAVERYRANDRSATKPAIAGASPTPDQAIRYLMLAPGWTRKITSEGVDVAPARYSLSQLPQEFRIQTGECCPVIKNQLISEKPRAQAVP